MCIAASGPSSSLRDARLAPTPPRHPPQHFGGAGSGAHLDQRFQFALEVFEGVVGATMPTRR
jgi:hypothetical protein